MLDAADRGVESHWLGETFFPSSVEPQGGSGIRRCASAAGRDAGDSDGTGERPPLSTLIIEIRDALGSAGTSGQQARVAAEVVAEASREED